MAIMKKIPDNDKCYVPAECRHCGKIFLIPDSIEKGKYNDTICRDFYCEDCLNLGYSNSKKDLPDEFLDSRDIKDKLVRREFKKIMKRGADRNRVLDNVLKDAIEIAEYIKEEQNEKKSK